MPATITKTEKKKIIALFSDAEYEVIRKRFFDHIQGKSDDPEMEKTMNKWWRAHDAVFHSLGYGIGPIPPNEYSVRVILSILFSKLSDAEKIKLFDKIVPPGVRPY